jgi:hypothetical protein
VGASRGSSSNPAGKLRVSVGASGSVAGTSGNGVTLPLVTGSGTVTIGVTSAIGSVVELLGITIGRAVATSMALTNSATGSVVELLSVGTLGSGMVLTTGSFVEFLGRIIGTVATSMAPTTGSFVELLSVGMLVSGMATTTGSFVEFFGAGTITVDVLSTTGFVVEFHGVAQGPSSGRIGSLGKFCGRNPRGISADDLQVLAFFPASAVNPECTSAACPLGSVS